MELTGGILEEQRYVLEIALAADISAIGNKQRFAVGMTVIRKSGQGCSQVIDAKRQGVILKIQVDICGWGLAVGNGEIQAIIKGA